MINKNNQACNAMSLLNQPMQGLTISTASSGNQSYYVQTTPSSNPITAWDYWSGPYYGQVITTSYPIYYQEKAMDKGKQAFEILKSLIDKKLVKLEKVADFVEAMDTILKTI